MQPQPRRSSPRDAETGPTVRSLGLRTATTLVAGSMIGSGVFTTSGFLLRDLPGPRWVLLAWLLGGVLATCGALAYAELGAALPENGGEYALLSRIYHPGAGFVAGWVSLVVGFSAPTAAAAMAFGAYVARIFPGVHASGVAAVLIVGVSAVHAAGARPGGRVHGFVTALDLVVIGLFVVAGLWAVSPAQWDALRVGDGQGAGVGASLAVGLVYVSFSFSGWNAAIYVAGELRDPRRTLPLSLIAGTAVVTLLYLLLNLVFVSSAPVAQLRGVLEIGHVAAEHLFGSAAAPWVSAMVALGLASSVSAALMAGPRVYERAGREYPALRALSGTRRGRGPVRAIALQAALALVLAVTATFDALLAYMGFTLTLVSAAAVLGVFVLRWREPELPRPYRAWGHPFTSLLALALMLWMMIFTLAQRPLSALAGLGTLASGSVLYLWLRRRSPSA